MMGEVQACTDPRLRQGCLTVANFLRRPRAASVRPVTGGWRAKPEINLVPGNQRNGQVNQCITLVKTEGTTVS